MHDTTSHLLDRFLEKIETRDHLKPDEREALLALPHKLVRTAARARIVEEGERPTDCCMVVDGLAYRSKLTAAGRRQIVSFHIPGDMIDLQTVLFNTADHTIETVRNSAIALIPHEAILRAAEEVPALGRAFWFDTLLDAAIQREALLNVGRRDARTRTAHLFCELAVRMQRIGLFERDRFDLALTQNDLADALGITPIHTNRVLASFRAEGLLTFFGGTVTIPNLNSLRAVAEFDPAYLQLEGPSDLHL